VYCRGLLYCMEYLEENLEEWLGGELEVGLSALMPRTPQQPACTHPPTSTLLSAASELGRPACPASCRLSRIPFERLRSCPVLCCPCPLSPPCTQAYGDDDYLLFDCPGQIELYSHLSVFRTFVEYLKRDGWQICVVRSCCFSAAGRGQGQGSAFCVCGNSETSSAMRLHVVQSPTVAHAWA
jgi:hypothetical protein